MWSRISLLAYIDLLSESRIWFICRNESTNIPGLKHMDINIERHLNGDVDKLTQILKPIAIILFVCGLTPIIGRFNRRNKHQKSIIEKLHIAHAFARRRYKSWKINF